MTSMPAQDDESLRFLVSLLIPTSRIDRLEDLMIAAENPEVAALLTSLKGLDRDAATKLVADFEREQSAAFAAFYDAVLVAHYSSQAAQTNIRALADRGPREVSGKFDPALLRQVVATQAGKRRL
ncbi:hypothetical protein [Devosia aurantiaca]|uniref:Uncharacterized protein n=1 Tax=Devosia aurantiaca TaxID=2714858 RepID=A0A6M1SWW1_9HYPH|nr:hypothetical protein [Devosia aurantiaca]NGP18813.1 hypothetical protein [Devosia aurantiaca]